MIIGIDARLAGIKNRGLGRYIENLINNLEIIDTKNQYYIFLYQTNFDEYHFKNPNFKKVKTNYRWYTLAEQLLFPWLIRKYQIDLMYYPHFNVPYLGPKNFGLTLHDLTLLHYPDRRVGSFQRATTLPAFFYKIKYFIFKILQKIVLKKAKFIITPSNFVKDDILNYYQINPDKIKVVYEGKTKINNKVDKLLLKKLTINKPFLLYLGAAYPHKNLERLIRAFLEINQNKEYQLVIAGRYDYFMNKLNKWLKQLPLATNEIVFTDLIDDKTLANLYQNALLFVMPSLSEGFGLPAIEAQAYGLPVVSSNQTSLKEILGKSALFFNPFDITDISNKINLLIANLKLQEKLRKLGFLNSKKYDWLSMTKKILEIFNNFDKS